MGCSHGHLLGADEAGNVLPVQKHMLHTVHIAHLQPDARQERRHGILILTRHDDLKEAIRAWNTEATRQERKHSK